jgi:hypothetical protein
MRMQLSAFAARLQSRVGVETFATLAMFLGESQSAFAINAVGAFTPPIQKLDKTTPEKISSRIKLNFVLFLSNYALYVCMYVCIVIWHHGGCRGIMHPGMLFFVGISGLLVTPFFHDSARAGSL